MKEIRRYPYFVLFVVYIAFITSILLQVSSTWWIRHSYCTVPLYCQFSPNLKINYKKVFAFMLKVHVFALLMHFLNRFCCSLWASRYNLKGTCKKVIWVAKLNFAKFATNETFIYIFHGNLLEGTRKARK